MSGTIKKRLPIITDDPVELSTRVIDTGEHDEMVNRTTQKLSVLDDDIAIVESFSHIIAFRTDDGLVCFDSSGQLTGEAAVAALRGWSDARIDSLVYTHGHVDHVGGSGAMAADAERRGHRPITVVGHEAVGARFDRYRLTNGYNTDVNLRQFGGVDGVKNMAIGDVPRFLPDDVLWPDVEVGSAGRLDVGGAGFEMHHAKGETDDHLWTWVPGHRALCVGDLVTWVFPNCGNPQKVQRYPLEWAAALREMMTYEADWLFGAHGLPVRGAERVATVLGDLANALELLTEETLAMMNAGETLDAIVHQVTVPDELLAKPWMQPVYDEPEFVVRNLWRLYGGWWDKNPAHLKPAPESAFAAEISTLVGGSEILTARAVELAAAGELRLACQVIELAVQADPESLGAHGARAEIYAQRRSTEFSLMSKGVYAAASRESKAIVENE